MCVLLDCRKGAEYLLSPGPQLYDVQHPHTPIVRPRQAAGVPRSQSMNILECKEFDLAVQKKHWRSTAFPAAVKYRLMSLHDCDLDFFV